MEKLNHLLPGGPFLTRAIVFLGEDWYAPSDLARSARVTRRSSTGRQPFGVNSRTWNVRAILEHRLWMDCCGGGNGKHLSHLWVD
jgi:hypothetical protein